ncbi:hypothetical protein DE146DRAFT_607468 [Phaeosphaeria sp. MPI-PUGE-AT-0046c]|nr:hypothetical protein DE146DRAFT_607468 [Phaeosphaeria sp. MPI-PUGE-AT-0046c]
MPHFSAHCGQRGGISDHIRLCQSFADRCQCDELRPNCTQCVKQGTSCEYRQLTSREASLGSPRPVATISSSTEHSNGTPTAQFREESYSTDLNISQLRLLHHYTTVTARTLAHSTESEAVFATNLVETAFDHPFLLHAVLALAAVHLSRLDDPQSSSRTKYRTLADQHYDAALSGFRNTVRNIDQTNWKSVLMFAGALLRYSCTSTVTNGGDPDIAFDHFLSNLALTRQTRSMVTGFYHQLIESELGHLIPDDVKGRDWTTAEAPAETELIQLRKFREVIHHLYPPDIVDAYGYAIHVLELVFDVAAESSEPPSGALLMIWIHFVPDRYIELLTERQPGSLIILAHYAVLLRKSECYWYLEGVAEQLLSIVNAFIPTEWMTWLAWPKSQIHGNSITPMSN